MIILKFLPGTWSAAKIIYKLSRYGATKELKKEAARELILASVCGVVEIVFEKTTITVCKLYKKKKENYENKTL